MPEFTKAQELAAEYRNKMTYAMTILQVALEKKKQLNEKEIRSALGDLREAVKVIGEIERL